MSVLVVGRGKVGRSLRRALTAAGVECRLVAGRRFRATSPPARVCLLAVPDGRIRALAEEIARSPEPPRSVLHLAGARGLAELAPLAARGVRVGVCHPLVSFADARGTLRGATFTCFGDPGAVTEARRLARRLGAYCAVIPEPSPAYHAAAALVANGAAALAHLGARLLVELGYSARDAERALSALLASVAGNVARVGVPAALTGPVVRGDVETVGRHLAALREVDPNLAASYAALQPVVVQSARAAGLDAVHARRILRRAQLSR